MVVVERLRFGILRCIEVYFAREDQLTELVRNLGPLDLLYGFSRVPLSAEGIRPLVQNQRKTTLVDLSNGQEAIWAELHANCRYKVRRAAKIDDRFAIAMNTEAACADFRQLYNHFAQAKGKLPLLTARGLQSYLPQADVFTLYYEGRPTCGRLVLRDEESRMALMLYSATRRLEPGADTITIGLLNRYLHWHEMKTYQAAGMYGYDFGGAGDAYPSVTRFKLSFGGEVSVLHYCVYAGTVLIWKLWQSVSQLHRQRRFKIKHVTA
jgi:hypothetical protein